MQNKIIVTTKTLLCVFLCFASLVCFAKSNKPLQGKQQRFIQKLLPAVRRSNAAIAKQRHLILLAHTDLDSISPDKKHSLQEIAKHYNIKSFNTKKESAWKKLLARVDTIPESLVIAQAINESAWGQSRFARDANNYFGQWCYHLGCGLIPKKRGPNSHHEVQKFPSTYASVNSYIHNLNTHPAYQQLRALRMKMRLDGKTPSGLQLANGLLSYSSRGYRYIHSIQQIIKRYHLQSLNEQPTGQDTVG